MTEMPPLPARVEQGPQQPGWALFETVGGEQGMCAVWQYHSSSAAAAAAAATSACDCAH